MDTPFDDSQRRREPAPNEPAEPRAETAAERRDTELAAADELRSELTSREKRLSDARRALLAQRLRGRAKTTPVETIPRRPAHEPARLSYVQEQLWFLDQLNPGRSAYNMPFPRRLEGPLEPAVLAASFAEILRRHEVLRATFQVADGAPVMVFTPPARRSLPLIDLAALVAPEREQELRRLIDAEVERPFDLARGPLARLTLLRQGDDDHVLIFNLHHIVFDGWSLGVLLSELSTLYRAFQDRRSAPGGAAPYGLEELPIQYADFAHRQRHQLREEGLKGQIEYWRRQLAGAPSLVELPTDRPRPTRPRLRGKGLGIALPEALAEPLNALSQRHDATLFMTMLAAFKTLLYRHSGQRDLVVGTPIAGRNHKELEGLIGFFVNTLALRTHLPATRDPSFLELLEHVRQVAMDGYSHQELPFEQVVRELAPERSAGTNPLFQVMFVLQTASSGKADMAALKLRPLGMSWGTAKFDLSMLLSGTGMTGFLEFDTDLFDDTTSFRLIEHFERLLAEILEDPERRLGELPLLSAAERHQLLEAWNDTDAPLPRVAGVVELFSVQAARTPDRVALVLGVEQLSYRELEGRSNRLAHYLQALGVDPEVPVGVAVKRSVDLIVAMFAVFKSGGFLVPLDRTLPADRLAFIIDDAGVELILTRRDSQQHLPAHQARVVFLEDAREVIARQPESTPPSGATADNLGYLIYTSGTTGRPKGISMVHRVLTNLTRWQLRSTPPDAGLRTPQFAPLSFDIIFQETFSTLCAGGTLLLLTEEERRDAVLLVDRLDRHRIERLYQPFVALQQLCELA
ncbi:MAG: AMP-binding protein, partial [bacterium]|nr:AMP-binding protein [bacterium]